MKELLAALKYADLLLDIGYWVTIYKDRSGKTSMQIGKIRDDGVKEYCQAVYLYYTINNEVRYSVKLFH